MQMLRVISFILILSTGHSYAQKIEPKHTFNVELGLPNSTNNKAFKTIMQGLVNASTYYQYAMKNSLAFGVGLKYSFFDVNEFKTPEPIFGGMHSAVAFFKIGSEKFHTDRFATDIGVKLGYAMNLITTDLNENTGNNPRRIDATFLEPTLGLILTADEKTSYRLVLGYAFQGFKFSPDQLGTKENGGYIPADLQKPNQFFTIGFGFTYYMLGKE